MNIFKSTEDIDDIKSNLNPIIIETWRKWKPYVQLHDTFKIKNKGDINIQLNYNNPIIKENASKLYDIFLNRVSSIFKNFTIDEVNEKSSWVYISDKNFTKNCWHNHIGTASITGVFYLKCVKDRGIYFNKEKENGNQIYIKPKENELYIFPGDLYHLPMPSTNDNIRISCNVELKCNESIKELFDPKNILEKKFI